MIPTYDEQACHILMFSFCMTLNLAPTQVYCWSFKPVEHGEIVLILHHSFSSCILCILGREGGEVASSRGWELPVKMQSGESVWWGTTAAWGGHRSHPAPHSPVTHCKIQSDGSFAGDRKDRSTSPCQWKWAVVISVWASKENTATNKPVDSTTTPYSIYLFLNL